MSYQDNIRGLETATKILKVNHAGEFGAINIYKAQLFVCNIFMKQHVPMLNNFLSDETRHLNLFWEEINTRNGIKCKSFWLCGVGGYFMGFISAFLGKKGIMACTWAVESVVINHLHKQLAYLSSKNDVAAYDCVKSILDDEINHRDTGYEQGGTSNFLYTPFRFMVSTFTESVIRFGMR